ncbi:MAG: EF-hand domain-containing protein [Pseudomonadota bacterium]
MKTSKTLIALSAAALLPLGMAVAAEGQYAKDKAGTMEPSFDKLDTNRDGKISQAEASADTNLVFSSADANGDGYVDKSEWKNRQKGSTSPAPQSLPDPSTDPVAPQSSEPAPADTETPRQ